MVCGVYWNVTGNDWFHEVMIVKCRLLDMGFEKDISRVVLALDEHGCQRQTVLLSATLTTGISFILYFLLCRAMQPMCIAWYKLWLCVCPAVCYTLLLFWNVWTDLANIMAQRLSSAHPVSCCYGIWVSPKIRVIPSVTIVRMLNLAYFSAAFATALQSSQALLA